MAVSATLRTPEVVVAPGGAGRCHVVVRNNSAVVDQFAFSVRGTAADWTQVRPSVVNLLPQQEVSVELTFLPPRSHEVRSGEHPFALQVTSREDPGGSIVQEGTVTVEPFVEVEAAVVPVTSTGRRSGKHTVALDNLGNHPFRVEVSCVDADALLSFRVSPSYPELAPGTTSFARIRARPHKYFWKGEDKHLPFTIRVLVPDSPPIEIEAAYDQRALVPQRVFWLVSILFGLLMVLVIIVTMILRQRPATIAGPAPTRTTTASSAPSSTTSSPVPSSTAAATTTRAPVVPAAPAVTSSAPAPVTSTFVIDTQVFPNVGGGPQRFSYVVPDGPRRRVMSVKLRNPRADTGVLRIMHESAVIGVVDLAVVNRDGNAPAVFVPDDPPLLAPGDRVTLAVSCTNQRDPCTPSGEFTVALVR
ncbi:MSP (Major sperm protein) domain-containing protein [Lentzea fradiae]|uniref:MSP (Major sperm protein) domain-containing protein n=1 Tax=Lentzea fradiae TaxID=200378 RepID=A0A1G7L8R6_9PSEU|nr:mobile sperm domain-containing protein [Lentzea fradiae]SDF45409.1 MSP (Major sperm protein) domain-containing protein [Lentzea fradiae]